MAEIEDTNFLIEALQKIYDNARILAAEALGALTLAQKIRDEKIAAQSKPEADSTMEKIE